MDLDVEGLEEEAPEEIEEEPTEIIVEEESEAASVEDAPEPPKKKRKSRKKRVSEEVPATAEIAEEVKRPSEPKDESSDVAIQSMWPGVLKAKAPSGKEYIWPKPGSIVMVAADDAAFVMSKNRSETRGCCGGEGGRTYFQFA